MYQCATETRFWYQEPKPRSNFDIGIGAETIFLEMRFLSVRFGISSKVLAISSFGICSGRNPKPGFSH